MDDNRPYSKRFDSYGSNVDKLKLNVEKRHENPFTSTEYSVKSAGEGTADKTGNFVSQLFPNGEREQQYRSPATHEVAQQHDQRERMEKQLQQSVQLLNKKKYMQQQLTLMQQQQMQQHQIQQHKIQQQQIQNQVQQRQQQTPLMPQRQQRSPDWHQEDPDAENGEETQKPGQNIRTESSTSIQFSQSFEGMTVHDLFAQCQTHLNVINACTDLQQTIKDEMKKQAKLDNIICQKLMSKTQRLQQKAVVLEQVHAPAWVGPALVELGSMVTQQAEIHHIYTTTLLEQCGVIQHSLDGHHELMKSVLAQHNQPTTPIPDLSPDTTIKSTNKLACSANKQSQNRRVEDVRSMTFLQASTIFEGIRQPRMKLLSSLEYQQEQLNATVTHLDQVQSEIEELSKKKENESLMWRIQLEKKDLEIRKDFLEARKEQLESDVQFAKMDLNDFEFNNKDRMLEVFNVFRQHRARYDTTLKQSFQLLKAASLRDINFLRKLTRKGSFNFNTEHESGDANENVSSPKIDPWSCAKKISKSENSPASHGHQDNQTSPLNTKFPTSLSPQNIQDNPNYPTKSNAQSQIKIKSPRNDQTLQIMMSSDSEFSFMSKSDIQRNSVRTTNYKQLNNSTAESFKGNPFKKLSDFNFSRAELSASVAEDNRVKVKEDTTSACSISSDSLVWDVVKENEQTSPVDDLEFETNDDKLIIAKYSDDHNFGQIRPRTSQISRGVDDIMIMRSGKKSMRTLGSFENCVNNDCSSVRCLYPMGGAIREMSYNREDKRIAHLINKYASSSSRTFLGKNCNSCKPLLWCGISNGVIMESVSPRKVRKGLKYFEPNGEESLFTKYKENVQGKGSKPVNLKSEYMVNSEAWTEHDDQSFNSCQPLSEHNDVNNDDFSTGKMKDALLTEYKCHELPTEQKLNEMSTGTKNQDSSTEQKLNEMSTGTKNQDSSTEQKLNEVSTGTKNQDSSTEQKLNEMSTGTKNQDSSTEQKLNEVSTGTKNQDSSTGDTNRDSSKGQNSPDLSTEKVYQELSTEKNHELSTENKLTEKSTGTKNQELLTGKKNHDSLTGQKNHELPSCLKSNEVSAGQNNHEVPTGKMRCELVTGPNLSRSSTYCESSTERNKDANERTCEPAKDANERTCEPAKDVNERTRDPAKDMNERTREPAKDVNERTREPAKEHNLHDCELREGSSATQSTQSCDSFKKQALIQKNDHCDIFDGHVSRNLNNCEPLKVSAVSDENLLEGEDRLEFEVTQVLFPVSQPRSVRVCAVKPIPSEAEKVNATKGQTAGLSQTRPKTVAPYEFDNLRMFEVTAGEYMVIEQETEIKKKTKSKVITAKFRNQKEAGECDGGTPTWPSSICSEKSTSSSHFDHNTCHRITESNTQLQSGIYDCETLPMATVATWQPINVLRETINKTLTRANLLNNQIQIMNLQFREPVGKDQQTCKNNVQDMSTDDDTTPKIQSTLSTPKLCSEKNIKTQTLSPFGASNRECVQVTPNIPQSGLISHDNLDEEETLPKTLYVSEELETLKVICSQDTGKSCNQTDLTEMPGTYMPEEDRNFTGQTLLQEFEHNRSDITLATCAQKDDPCIWNYTFEAAGACVQDNDLCPCFPDEERVEGRVESTMIQSHIGDEGNTPESFSSDSLELELPVSVHCEYQLKQLKKSDGGVCKSREQTNQEYRREEMHVRSFQNINELTNNTQPKQLEDCGKSDCNSYEQYNQEYHREQMFVRSFQNINELSNNTHPKQLEDCGKSDCNSYENYNQEYHREQMHAQSFQSINELSNATQPKQINDCDESDCTSWENSNQDCYRDQTNAQSLKDMKRFTNSSQFQKLNRPLKSNLKKPSEPFSFDNESQVNDNYQHILGYGLMSFDAPITNELCLDTQEQMLAWRQRNDETGRHQNAKKATKPKCVKQVRFNDVIQYNDHTENAMVDTSISSEEISSVSYYLNKVEILY